MSDKLFVNEIFNSIDGEGKRAGELASFIRLTGCNLRCSYCDTAYAFNTGVEMLVKDIVEQAEYRNITLTGGEPLCQDIHSLLKALSDRDVNIETNGSINIRPYLDYSNVFFTLDCKSISSGESGKMLMTNFANLRQRDVLKFVVGSDEDLKDFLAMYRLINPTCQVYLSPVFGRIEPARIVEFMQAHRLETCKVQLQLHKFIWEPTKRGV